MAHIIIEPQKDANFDQKTFDVIDDIKEYVNEVSSVESEWRSNAEDELDFLNSNQWPDFIAQTRQVTDSRPTLTINKIPAFLNQIVNQAKQNRPSMKVHPVGSGADVDISKILQGYLKHIEVISQAENAYDRALELAAQIGRGFLRIYTDYCSTTSFEQDIFITSIFNPFCVYHDPRSTDITGQDSQRDTITDYVSKEEFEAMYPDLAPIEQLIDFTADNDRNNDTFWFDSKKRIRIAEDFKKVFHKESLILLSNGKSYYESVLDTMADKKAIEHLKIKATRKTLRPEIQYKKVTGFQILEESIFPGEFIPIIPVYGNRNCIKGQIVFNGLIRLLQDPQYMFNYWRSTETQIVSQAPKNPWVSYDQVIEGYEQDYMDAANRPQAVLKAKIVHPGDNPMAPPLPLPQRLDFAGLPAGVIGAAQNAHADMQAVSGIYETALGNQSNEISGVAVDARVNQTNIGSFHYLDNQHKSIIYASKLCLKLIPIVIDTERMIRVFKPDSSSEMVKVNERVIDPLTNAVTKIKNDLTLGEYDIVPDVGPTYATRRQETAEVILKLAQVFPELLNVAPDLLVKNLDIAESSEIAARLGALLPPAIQQLNSPQLEEIDPKVKPLIAQLTDKVQQLTQQLNQVSSEFNQKVELERLNAEKEILIERIKHESVIGKSLITDIGKKDLEELRGYIQLLLHEKKIPSDLKNQVKQDENDSLNARNMLEEQEKFLNSSNTNLTQ